MSSKWNTLEFADKSTALLTFTSDMACYSFSLPAGPNGACPLSVTGEGTICGSCYAMINRYNMPNVLDAQYLRFAWVKDCLARWESGGKKDFVDRMTQAISEAGSKGGTPYFRWFDSGDFFHPLLIEGCHEVCKALPLISFWFPTRVWFKGTSDSWAVPLRKLANLPNVVVRPSAISFDDPPPRVKGLGAGTTAISTEDGVFGQLCPKTVNGGDCESNGCRSCWDVHSQISYLVHGTQGRSTPANAMSDNIQNKRKEYKATYASLTINRHAVA
jgi:hypothetical protein